MKKACFFLFFFLMATPGLAIIDMKNANFSTEWTDLINLPGGFEIKIQRTYNSRSLYKGIFGFGWCSDFETKLILSPEGTIKIFECGAGLETTYTKKGYGFNDIEKAIDKILKRLKLISDFSENDLNNLKNKLEGDNRLIIRMMIDLEIPGEFQNGEVYFNENNSVIIHDDYYEERLANGAYRHFDKAGRLIFNKINEDRYFSLKYDSGLLTEIQDNKYMRLTLHYDGHKKLSYIDSSPAGTVVKYGFDGDNLVYVNNGWGNDYNFEYDDLHNLTKITWPDNTYIRLSYDRDNDWVTSYRDRQGCIENYDYQSSKDNPQNHYWSIVKKTCGDKVVNNTKFEFFHKVNRLGSIVLYKTVTSTDGVTNEIDYDELSGRPVFISRNNRKEEIFFDYYSNGLLKTKTGKLYRHELAYDPQSNKVSRLRCTRLDDEGNIVSEKVSMFRWNAKGFLENVETDKGYKLNIIHDSHGRIFGIQDQDKKTVKIGYDDRFGNPIEITLSGLGTLHVKYASDGKINHVELGNGGRELAVQAKNFLETLLKTAVTVDESSDELEASHTPEEIASQINPIMAPIDKILLEDSTKAAKVR